MAKIYYISGTGKNRIGEIITWQSVPQYDPWGPGSGWTCEQWRQWHIALSAHYGPQQANLIFKQAWDNQGSFDSAYNWCKYNSPWINYFLSKGLDLRSALSAIVVPVVTLPGDVIENTTSTVSALSRLLKPLAFLAAGAAVYVGYKEINKRYK
jgi:hypothetical protein